MKIACILAQKEYKPGDMPPDDSDYLGWHEWADVQRKAAIKQVQCCHCCRWKTPQELSEKTHKWTAQSRKGPVQMTSPICSKCSEKYEDKAERGKV